MKIREIMSRRAFTLIELLVVIAIIAILAIVVVLTLNPSELLKQSRDASRVSDMATLNSALSLYVTDQAGTSAFSLGAASTSYASMSDPSATSSVDTQCQGLGLLSLSTSTGQAWACSSSTTYRSVSGLGWVPVNLTSISGGSPLGTLPQDPVNQSSSNLFYTYAANGAQFEVASIFESQKYRMQSMANPQSIYYPGVNAMGSNLGLLPLFNPNGLVGYWPLAEGSGTIAYDRSGNGNNATWAGTPAGTSGYYGSGKIGNWAGYFSIASANLATVGSPSIFNPGTTGSVTDAAWFQTYATGTYDQSLIDCKSISSNGSGYDLESRNTGIELRIGNGAAQANSGIAGGLLAGWHHAVGVVDRNAGMLSIYLDGSLVAQAAFTTSWNLSCANVTTLGGYNGTANFNGLINDARVYNRALSPAEVQALYNATK